jgi:hypothetical protein
VHNKSANIATNSNIVGFGTLAAIGRIAPTTFAGIAFGAIVL